MVRSGWRTARAEKRSSTASMAAIRSSIESTARTSFSVSNTGIRSRTLAHGAIGESARLLPPRGALKGMLGQRVGKYRVESRLGRGGMGTVYKAVDETLGREVAIKSLNADLGEPDRL